VSRIFVRVTSAVSQALKVHRHIFVNRGAMARHRTVHFPVFPSLVYKLVSPMASPVLICSLLFAPKRRTHRLVIKRRNSRC